jgi:hypothetical protein
MAEEGWTRVYNQIDEINPARLQELTELLTNVRGKDKWDMEFPPSDQLISDTFLGLDEDTKQAARRFENVWFDSPGHLGVSAIGLALAVYFTQARRYIS